MHIAVSNLIRASMEELLTGSRRRLLEADLALAGFLPGGSPEELKHKAWDREGSPVHRDAFWIDVIWAYRRPGGSHWGAVILALVSPVLIPALERFEDVADAVQQDAGDGHAYEPVQPRRPVPRIGLERPAGSRGMDEEDLAQHVLTEVLEVAASCRLPRPPRWTPHRLTTQAIRNVRRWLRPLAADVLDSAATDAVISPPAAADGDEITRLRALLAERGCVPADADLIISTRLLGSSLRLIAQTNGVPYQTLWRRRARALGRLRTTAP